MLFYAIRYIGRYVLLLLLLFWLMLSADLKSATKCNYVSISYGQWQSDKSPIYAKDGGGVKKLIISWYCNFKHFSNSIALSFAFKSNGLYGKIHTPLRWGILQKHGTCINLYCLRSMSSLCLMANKTNFPIIIWEFTCRRSLSLARATG